MKPILFLAFLGFFLFFLQFHPGKPLTVDSRVTLDTVIAFAHGRMNVPERMVTRIGKDGQHYSLYGPLLSLAALPGYMAGSLFDSEPETESSWACYAALATNQWVVSLGLVLLLSAGLSLPAGRHGVWDLVYAGMLAATSTMLLPYSRDFFSQPLAGLCLLAGFLCLLKAHCQFSWRGMSLSCFFTGAAVLARMDMAAVLPAHLLGGILIVWKHGKDEASGNQFGKMFAHMLLPLAIGPVLMCGFDWLRWGSFMGTPYQRMPFTTPLIDSLPRFFFSPDLSFPLWNPLCLAGLYFMHKTWRSYKPVWIAILLSDLLYLIVVSKYVDYHGGICPGPRYLASLVALNLLPLFVGIAESGGLTCRMRFGLAALCIPGLLLNLYSGLVDYSNSPGACDYWREIISIWH